MDESLLKNLEDRVTEIEKRVLDGNEDDGKVALNSFFTVALFTCTPFWGQKPCIMFKFSLGLRKKHEDNDSIAEYSIFYDADGLQIFVPQTLELYSINMKQGIFVHFKV